MKRLNLALASLASMSGVDQGLFKLPAPRVPKKPWQTRPDYLRKPTICKNPKTANHVNMMFNKNYGEKFGYAKTDFT